MFDLSATLGWLTLPILTLGNHILLDGPGIRLTYRRAGQDRSRATERERDELPGQISAHQAELAATPTENKPRRERPDWLIRNLQKRLAEVEARLAGH